MGLLLGSGISSPQYPYTQWYGVKGNYSSSDNVLTRVGNLDLHRTLPIQGKLKRFVENTDGSVKYYLHQNDSRLRESGAGAILDAADGNVMLEVPEYYLRYEKSGTEWIYAISEYPLPGFHKLERKAIAPWYSTINSTTGKAKSGCFLTWNGDVPARDGNGICIFSANAANFRGGSGTSDASKDGTYNSQLGMGRTYITKAGARAACENGTHIGVYRAYNQIAWLQRIEYANLDAQATYNATLTADGFHQGGLGSGTAWASATWSEWGGYRPFIPGGVTAPIGNNTGRVTFSVKKADSSTVDFNVVSYRGLEVPFEFITLLADDVLIWHKDDVSQAFVCEDPTKFTSHSDSATTVPEGYVLISDLPRTSGYISHCNQDGIKGYTFPRSVSGPYIGYRDYFYTPVGNNGRGWFGALLSGDATYGTYAGFDFLRTSYRSSSSVANVGFRLCRN